MSGSSSVGNSTFLVFLNKTDAKLEKGTRGFRTIAMMPVLAK